MQNLLFEFLDPINSPLRWFCLLGWASHWSWRWFAAYILSCILTRLIAALAAGGVAMRASTETARTYFREPRYSFQEVELHPDFLRRFDVAAAIGADDRLLDRAKYPDSATQRTRQSVRAFVIQATEAKWKLGVSSRCLHNPDGPTIIFLRRPFENIEPAGAFELFHEIGHASRGGLEAEIHAEGELLVIIISSTVLWMTLPHIAAVAVCAATYFMYRLIRWRIWVLGPQAEVAADAYAVKRLAGFPGGPAVALDAARDYVTMWLNELKQRRTPRARRNELHFRIVYMLRAVELIEAGRYGDIPERPRGFSSRLYVAVFLAYTLSAVLAGDFPGTALRLLGFVAILILAALAFETPRRDRLARAIEATIQRASNPVQERSI